MMQTVNGKNDFSGKSKILLDINSKIILLKIQTGYSGYQIFLLIIF